MSDRIIREIQASVELAGRELSADALDVFAAELELYPEEIVLEAIHRTRMEVSGRFILPDVLDRMRGSHPGTEEAWAMVSKALTDEGETLVMTAPMRTAFFAAIGLGSDLIAARMAFKEVYQKEVSSARAQRLIFPTWLTSIGADKGRREVAIKEALIQGKLSPEQAAPWLEAPVKEVIKLLPPEQRALLESG